MPFSFVLLLLLPSILRIVSCSTPPAVTPALLVTTTIDHAFEGYTSDSGSWSPVFCPSGSTYRVLGTVVDCCRTIGSCHQATACFGSLVFSQGGSVQTCTADCSTGLVFSNIGGTSPHSMFGCFDPFQLYRTIDAAASSSIAATVTRATTTTTLPSATTPTLASAAASSAASIISSRPTSSLATSNPSTSHSIKPVIVAAAVIVVLLLLSAVIGLLAYIFVLRKRPSKATLGSELRHMPPDARAHPEAHAELPGNQVWPAELPSPAAAMVKQNPWEMSTPHTPEQKYGGAAVKEWNSGIAELPASRLRGHGHYQELPG